MVFRPGREAEIVRRLLRRHRGAFPRPVIVRLWRELLSARLGDILSYLYLASMVLKHYEDQGRNQADLPLVEWACRHLLYRTQEQFHSFMRNFPNRWVAPIATYRG